jgi:hypothetical protein
VYEKQVPEGLQNTVSVSTKFATFPSSSIPLELNLVPALREESREITVRVEGRFERALCKRGVEAGIVSV